MGAGGNISEFDTQLPRDWRYDLPATLYGYFTEIVKTGVIEDDDHDALIADMRAKGFNVSDLCHFNTGYLPNGKLVAHDWDASHACISF